MIGLLVLVAFAGPWALETKLRQLAFHANIRHGNSTDLREADQAQKGEHTYALHPLAFCASADGGMQRLYHYNAS